MINHLSNSDGYIYAYIEWNIVNQKGQFEENECISHADVHA